MVEESEYQTYFRVLEDQFVGEKDLINHKPTILCGSYAHNEYRNLIQVLTMESEPIYKGVRI